MKLKILILLFFQFSLFSLFATNDNAHPEISQKPKDTDANVIGHVVDKKTDEHIHT